MPKLRLTWDGKSSAQKVALTKLLRLEGGLPLDKAKRVTDACIRRESVVIDLPDPILAFRLVEEINKLGFVAETVENADDSKGWFE